MYKVVFSRESFPDGTVLYHVDVEDVVNREILFSAPITFDTLEQAESYATRVLSSQYERSRWMYSFLSEDDFVDA